MCYIFFFFFFRIRGRLGSMIMVSVNTGVLVGYILATNVDYYIAPYFIIPLPICYIIGNLFLPETPFFLIRNGKFDAAEKSFRFYKNIGKTDKTAMVEFEDIKQALTQENNSENYTFHDFSKCFQSWYQLIYPEFLSLCSFPESIQSLCHCNGSFSG